MPRKPSGKPPGRPRLDPAATGKALSVRLSTRQREALERAAADKGITASTLVQNLIESLAVIAPTSPCSGAGDAVVLLGQCPTCGAAFTVQGHAPPHPAQASPPNSSRDIKPANLADLALEALRQNAATRREGDNRPASAPAQGRLDLALPPEGARVMHAP